MTREGKKMTNGEGKKMTNGKRMRRGGFGRWFAIALVALLASVAIACGGDDGDNGSAATEEATAEFTAEEVTATIEVEMADFEFIPKDAKGPAGIDEVVTPNIGEVEHELQLYKTDVDPGSLTVDAETGKADTEPLGERLFENFADAGETDSNIADLDAGQYAMVCNIAGHYEAGMWGSMTIK
jgi:uncharacterized cupredoxin-like copper-binding protein